MVSSLGCGVELDALKRHYALRDVVNVTGHECPGYIQATIQPTYYDVMFVCAAQDYMSIKLTYALVKDYEIEGFSNNQYTSIDWDKLLDLLNQFIDQYGDEITSILSNPQIPVVFNPSDYPSISF